MPITPSIDAITGRTPPRRKKKKKPGEEAQADLAQRIASAESASYGTLPSDFVYAAAASATDDYEAARAAAALARETDLPPVSLVRHGRFPGKPFDYFADPVSGGPMSLRSSRRYDQKFIAKTLGPILAQAKGKERVDPDAVLAYVRAMGPLPGNVPVDVAVGAAFALISDNVNIGRFTSAMAAFAEYNGETGPYSDDQILAFSHKWAQDKSLPQRPTRVQVQAFLNPGVAVARQIQAEEVAQTEAQAEEALKLGRANLTEEQKQQFLATAAADERAKLDRLRLDANGQPGRYDRLAKQILTQRAQEEIAAQNSFVKKSFDGLMRGLDVAWHKTGGAALAVAAGLATTAKEALFPTEEGPVGQGALEAFHTTWEDAADVFFMRQRPGEVVARDAGFEEGTAGFNIVSAGSELLAAWYLDPLVALGHLRRAAGLRRGLLVTSMDDPTLKGTGVFKSLAITRKPVEQRIGEFLRHKVKRSWRSQAGVDKDMTFVEWLARMSADPKKHDLAAELPRGLYGHGEGVSREVLNVTQKWMRQRGFTPEKLARTRNLPDDVLAEVSDIFMVSIGAKESMLAGRQFRALLDDGLDAAARGRAKTAVKRDITQKTLTAGGKVDEEAAGIVAGFTEKELAPFRAEALGQRTEKLAKRLLPEDDLKALPLDEQPGALQRARDEAERLVGTEQEAVLLGKPKPLTFADALDAIQFTQRSIPIIRGPLSGLREARLGLSTSRFWRSKAAAWLRPAFEMKPGTALNIEAFKGDLAFARWLKNFETGGRKVFTPARISELRAKWVDLASLPRPNREILWEKFLRSSLHEAYGGLGLPAEVVEEIVERAAQGYGHAKGGVDMAFGYVKGRPGQGPVPEVLPVFETQTLNTLILPDPQLVMNSIRDAYGGVSAVRNKALKKFGREIEDLMDDEVRELLDSRTLRTAANDLRKRGSRRFRETLLSIWKPAVLLRPAWTVRVVLIEENLRALTALSSMADRLLAIKGVGRLAEKAGLQERYLQVPGIDEPIPLFRASGALPDEPAAGAAGRAEALSSSVKYDSDTAARLKAVGRAMKPGNKAYPVELSKILNQQIGQSPLGRMVVESMLGRRSRDDVVRWLAKDDRAAILLTRKGTISPDDAVQRAEEVISFYTKNDQGMLEAILAKEVSPELIARTWPKIADRPEQIHALTVDEALLRRANPMRSKVDALFNVFAKRPTDYLSRQPLFKALYTRERERLLRVVAARRETATGFATKQDFADVLPSVERRAKAYALGETKRVMYSLTERSRFADAHQFLLPFFAPFQEQLSVWSQLIWQNPAAIGHARLVADAAMDTGFVRRDEEGNLIVPLSAWAFMGPIAGMVFGLPTKKMPQGFALSTRLESLNLFLQSAIDIPTGGFAGDVSLPMPGFAPWAMAPIQAAVKAAPADFPGKSRLMAWAFTFGPGIDIIPRPWARIIAGVYGLKGGRTAMLEDAANDFLDYAAAGGMSVAADEKDIERLRSQGVNEEMIYTLADARRDASKFLIFRAFAGWLSPGAPEIEFPDEAIREEFRAAVDTHGWNEARRLLTSKYPDRPDIQMLAISHTLWGKDGPSIPATEAAEAFLNHPEFAEAAKRFPDFALFLIPKEAREGQIDSRLYQAQLAEGARVARTPDERITELQRQRGWQAYFAARHAFDAATEGLDEDSGSYARYRRTLDDSIAEIAALNPAWEVDKYTLEIRDPALDDNLRRIRSALANSPILTETEFGRTMTQYLVVRDEIEAEMDRYDIDSLTSSGAKMLKLDKRYETLVMESRAASEDFSRAYDLWLSTDLRTNVETKRDEWIRENVKPKYLTTVLQPWEEEWERRQDEFSKAVRATDQARAGLAMREWALQAVELGKKHGINPQEAWWNTKTEAERLRLRFSTSMKPYVFLSPFEKTEILGLESSGEAEQLLVEIARDRLRTQEAARKAKAAGDGDRERELWKAHDAFAANLGKTNKALAEELQRQRKWGYGFFSALPQAWSEGPTGAATAWRQIDEFVATAQKLFDQHDINSYDEGYEQTKVAFEDWVVEWVNYSELFRGQWEFLDSLNQDRLVDVLFPSTYFPPKGK
jgi:hypothetical protein